MGFVYCGTVTLGLTGLIILLTPIKKILS
jgi:hypothetical protein